MTTITLADLVAPITQQDALSTELAVAQAIGLPTTAWQPLDVDRSTLAVNSYLIQQYSEIVNLIAQGGFASYAAKMVDDQGNSITTWMDLIGTEVFNVVRPPATFATGPVPVTTGSIALTWTPNSPLHFQNGITGATYTSLGSGTISSSGSGNVSVVADVAGIASSTGAGQTLAMLTPVAGVTVQPLVSSLVGADAATNAMYLLLCQAKLAAISPNGAWQAYAFVALSIPQGTPSAVPPYFVSSPITRVSVQVNVAVGTVVTYLANAAGAPPSGDVTVVNAAIQNQVVPQAITAVVEPAAPITVPIAYTVYVPKTSGLTPAQVENNIATNLAKYFAAVPIGGLSTTQPNIIPYNDLVTVILFATGAVDVTLTNPPLNTNVTLSPSSVAVLGGITANVVLV